MYLLGAILVFAFLFSYYFLGYIPSRERQMNDRGIRLMNQMAKSSQERMSQFKKSANLFACDYEVKDFFERTMQEEPDANLVLNKLFDADLDVFCRESTIENLYSKFDEIVDTATSEGDETFDLLLNSIINELSVDRNLRIVDSADSKDLFIMKVLDSNKRVIVADPEVVVSGSERLDFFDDVILTRVDDGRVIDQSQLNFQFFTYEPGKEDALQIKDEDLAEIAKDQEEKIEKHDDIYRIPNVDIVEHKIAGKKYFCFTRLINFNGQNYYLTGLIDEDNYYGSVRQVSIWTVLVAILVMLFLVQLMPLLKPFILSPKERLQGRDITWSAASLVLGTAVVTLLIIGVDTFAIEEVDLIDAKLKKYADSTNHDFQSELDTNISLIKRTMRFYGGRDEIVKNNQALKELKGMYWLSGEEKKYLIDSINGPAYPWRVRPKMKFLDIDNNGISLFFNINEKSKDVQIINKSLNLSHRDYVKALRGAVPTGAWLRNVNSFQPQDSTLCHCDTVLKENFIEGDNSMNGQRIAYSDSTHHIDSIYCCEPTYYFIESLLSLATGTFETVVAIKDAGSHIYASVSPFESVNKRYLEPGYTFSIIDREGNIHYDTDSSRIGTENFLAESDQNAELISLLNNRSKSAEPLKFSLKEYHMYVQPLENTPWFIVTKYNIRRSRLNVAQSMIITFQVVLSLLIYLFLLHWLHKLPYVLNNRVKRKDFSYLFLSPVNASPQLYWFLAIINVFFTLLLIRVYGINQLSLQINVAIYFGVLTQAILFNYSLLKRYSRVYTSGEMKEILGLNPFEWSLVIFWLFWMAITYNEVLNSSGFVFIMIIQVIMALLYAFFKIKTPLKERFIIDEDIEQKHFTAFYGHTFSWVFMLGIASCFMFFKPIYNQIHIKRAYANWVEEYDYRNNHNIEKSNKLNLFVSNENDADTISGVEYSSAFLDKIAMYFEEDGEVLYGQQNNENGIKLTITESKDTNEGLPFFTLAMEKTTHRVRQVPMENNRVVAFALPSLDHTKKPQQSMVFWGIIVLLIGMLYISIVQLSQKFFYLNILRRLRVIAKTKTDLNEAGAVHKDQLQIMLIGPPSSGRNSVAKGWFKKGAPIYYIDFLNEISVEAAKLDALDVNGNDLKGKPIIINNFDHRSDDAKLNLEKLALMEKLIRYRNEMQIQERLVLITHYGTDQFMQLYQAKMEQLRLEKADAKAIADLADAMERWQSILYEFVNKTMSLEYTPSDDFIERELNIGYSLPRFIPHIKSYREQLKKQEPDMSEADVQQKLIDAIINSAQNYYFAVWNACTPSERLLMFDLAEDGLVNTKNETLMADLVDKGLLRTEPTLRLFNRSFSQFVLENIPEEEGAKLEKLAKGDGLWGTYQIIVAFIIFAILIFLSFAEKEVMAKILGIISLAGAIIPKLINFTSKVGGPKSWFTKST
jgi:hypothetical protein